MKSRSAIIRDRRLSSVLPLLFLIAPAQPGAAAGHVLDLREPPAEPGLRVESGFAGAPDQEGVLRRYRLELPPFEQAVYWAAYQKYDSAGPRGDRWPNTANRAQPLVHRDLGQAAGGGFFALLKLSAGGYLALLPVSGGRTLTWFSGGGDHLALNLGTLGTGAVKGDLPLLAWARSGDPYDACRNAWEAALRHPLIRQSTRPRETKRYPEAFRYLGWCSWEEYRGRIDEKVLLAAVDSIEAANVPVRWLLVDNGYVDEDGRRLVSFRPNSKFPRGWDPLLARRKPDQIRWMGLWLNFNGYWNGVHPGNKLGPLNEHLEKVSGGRQPIEGGTLQPRPGADHSFAFFNAMIGAAREAGFDFVKVDAQAGNLELYRGHPQPVEAVVGNARALEAAAALHMDGLINCMAHSTLHVFNTRISAVSRSSEDYLHGDLPRARRHLHNSYGNIPWLGHTVWGDHDMFHSEDAVAGRMMAVSKAMSGGPVYLSDDPRRFVAEHIRPLCYRDGELLRPLAPATPLAESLFVDPIGEPAPFRVIAPLENESAAIVVYNLTEPERSVTGYVEPSDYRQAGAMMQPRATWPVPEQGLILYDWYARQAMPLRERYAFRMEKFSDRHFLVCPVRHGWAVVGRTDKFLSPAAVRVLHSTPKEITLVVKEGGPVAVWQADAKAAVESEDSPLRKIPAHLWEVVLTPEKRNALVRIRR